MTIQRHVRGHAVRQLLAKQMSAATCIQAHWRCHQDAARFAALCRATLRLQAWARAAAARQQYRQIRAATLVLQVCQHML